MSYGSISPLHAVTVLAIGSIAVGSTLSGCGSTGFQSRSGATSMTAAREEGADASQSPSTKRDASQASSQTQASPGGEPERATASEGLSGRLQQETSIGKSAEPFFGENALCQNANVTEMKPSTGRRHIHLTGNKTSEVLKVEAGENLEEVCVFLAGNQTSFTLSIAPGAKVDALHVAQRGNDSRATVSVETGGALGQARFDQSGNQAQASVRLLDPALDGCALVRLRQRGAARGVTCSKPE